MSLGICSFGDGNSYLSSVGKLIAFFFRLFLGFSLTFEKDILASQAKSSRLNPTARIPPMPCISDIHPMGVKSHIPKKKKKSG